MNPLNSGSQAFLAHHKWPLYVSAFYYLDPPALRANPSQLGVFDNS
jgi:hypothetical protein